jgi:hypothetical protein
MGGSSIASNRDSVASLRLHAKHGETRLQVRKHFIEETDTRFVITRLGTMHQERKGPECSEDSLCIPSSNA